MKLVQMTLNLTALQTVQVHITCVYVCAMLNVVRRKGKGLGIRLLVGNTKQQARTHTHYYYNCVVFFSFYA